MRIAVLGAGMVGSAIALDLARNYQVCVFDINRENLDNIVLTDKNVQAKQMNLLADGHYSWLEEFDIVVTAVPGFMGYTTLESVIKTGKNIVDISFFPENALQLNELAKQHNCTVITDCGVAPGMSNFIIGRYAAVMKIDSVSCYVGGLPKDKTPPFNYKAPFSPVDVIEEYTRPARLKVNGEIVTRPAMSEQEIIPFEGVGELEAFNTDGLRSLLFTLPDIPDMKEKTLRYPGHAKLISDLRDSGFFGEEPVIIDGVAVTPLAFTSRLLIDQWKLQPGEEEFTVMRVTLSGEGKKIEYNLLDRYNRKTGISSMARTTGYTCTAAVNLIAHELFTKKGVFPPELVGADEKCFDFLINYLKDRNVNWQKTSDVPT